MCGRAYETYTEAELAALDEHGEAPDIDWLSPNYNLAPTEASPVVVVRDDTRVFESFRWGLVPPWAPSVQAAAKYALINARGEQIAETRSYAEPLRHQRCVVPLSGFYEWKRDGRTKQPFAVSLRNGPVMAVAGVWERWQPNSHTPAVHSFSIVTTTANEFMADIHDRMPVILRSEDIDQWLDPEVHEPERVLPLIRPCPSEWLIAHAVSTAVNSVRNKSADLLQPCVAQEQQSTFDF
ncbi:MAG: SOS response-associated peptidase [Acidobacteria bacterium]|nr:SOS response-associated peptidase [Acidobacteriota bacterium]